MVQKDVARLYSPGPWRWRGWTSPAWLRWLCCSLSSIVRDNVLFGNGPLVGYVASRIQQKTHGQDRDKKAPWRSKVDGFIPLRPGSPVSGGYRAGKTDG